MEFDKALLIKAITKEATKKAELVVEKTLGYLVDELMFLSPVGQPDLWASSPSADYEPGTYKANWQHSINTPKTDVLAEVDDSVLQSNCKTGRKIKSSIKANNKLGVTHIFRNNVPYAQAIEYGSAIHNPQAQSKPFAVAGLVTAHIEEHLARAKREVLG